MTAAKPLKACALAWETQRRVSVETMRVPVGKRSIPQTSSAALSMRCSSRLMPAALLRLRSLYSITICLSPAAFSVICGPASAAEGAITRLATAVKIRGFFMVFSSSLRAGQEGNLHVQERLENRPMRDCKVRSLTRLALLEMSQVPIGCISISTGVGGIGPMMRQTRRMAFGARRRLCDSV